jgi:hypothetical protein
MRLALAVGLALVAAAGCGGSGHSASTAASGSTSATHGAIDVTPIGSGTTESWVYAPHGRKPRSIILFFHGFGTTSPADHEAWLEHLATEGNAVVYPRYIVNTNLDTHRLRDAIVGVEGGLHLLKAKHLPVEGIGYSMGGRMVVEYSAVAPALGLPVPSSILSIFPGQRGTDDPIINLATVPRKVNVTIMAGDHDQVVGHDGPRQLLQRLEAARYPVKHLHVVIVHSKGSFVATHLSVFETSAAAKNAFWRPADVMIASQVAARGGH